MRVQKVQQDRAFRCETELERVRAQLKAALHENLLARTHIAALQVCVYVGEGVYVGVGVYSQGVLAQPHGHAAVLTHALMCTLCQSSWACTTCQSS